MSNRKNNNDGIAIAVGAAVIGGLAFAGGWLAKKFMDENEEEAKVPAMEPGMSSKKQEEEITLTNVEQTMIE